MVVKKLFQDVSLGEIFYINTKSINPGNTPNKKFWHYSIPAYDDNKEPTLDRGADIKSNKYLLETDSILVSKLNPRIKRVWKFQKSDRHEPSICSTEFMVYQPKIPNVDLEYYTQFFSSDIFQNKLLSLQNGTTGSRMRVTPSDTLSIPIPFPSINEQRKIAAILSSVDEAIEKTEAIIEQTEKVKKGLMQQLLTKGISHTRFKKTEIGEIPEEWEVCKIPDVLSNEKGSIKMGPFGSQIKKEDLTSSGVHIIGIENVLNKEYVHLGNRYISFEKFESLKTNQVLPGDVVITTMGTIGLADVIPEHIPTTIIDSHLIRLRVNKEKILNTYLAMIIQDYDLVKKQIKRMSQGGIMAGLNTSIIKSLSIPLPSLNEQRKIVNSLSSIDSKVQVETEKLIKLREIKKGLMQVLLTGKVRVKVDDEVVSS
ncbi:EcoKI restriction-modification system protein HsdS [[Flavobacterium] thermophilum]|nr:EcoKI restriction-modification system protein HsdS [[Flavobacterium] thermophilum]